jgi:hypothetical protein
VRVVWLSVAQDLVGGFPGSGGWMSVRGRRCGRSVAACGVVCRVRLRFPFLCHAAAKWNPCCCFFTSHRGSQQKENLSVSGAG